VQGSSFEALHTVAITDETFHLQREVDEAIFKFLGQFGKF